MDTVDAVVIGAGVVGLAIGREFARRGLETIVLERADAIGTGTSSRNSEVVHAGIYYPAGSWKARLCVAGRQRLYPYLESHGIAHRRCGKLLVATTVPQRDALADIQAGAVRNGVTDLRFLDREQVRAMEPALDVVAALWSPSTGIVDSHGLMLSLQGDLEAAGGALVLRSPVEQVDTATGARAHRLRIGGASPSTIAAHRVVNAAGLWAPQVASRIDGLPTASVPRSSFAKGCYFSLNGRAPFRHLVYPVPEVGGLGTHLTLDLAGQARFGPDVDWLETDDPDALDYRVDPARGRAFEAAIRRYWPGLPDGALAPAYSGVRPKVAGTQDFVLQGPEAHGIANLLNLFGIESPGLTASLALADEVVSRLA